MERYHHPQLIQFLQQDLAVSEEAIAMALKQSEHHVAPLHMVLWHYGLVSIEQLSQIFDWLVEQPLLMNTGFEI